MGRLAALYGYLLSALAVAGCAVLFGMMLVICADVLLRNVRLVPGIYSVFWANEVTEYALYLMTLLTAPWLLRQGQHIRIDIVLLAVPPRLAWYCEWCCDLIALACCVVVVFAGSRATFASIAIESMVIKTPALREWRLLTSLVVCFGLLAVEILFRMVRLYSSPAGPRADAVTTG